MTRVPKVLHYIFGMASDFGGKPWSLVHHVCLKSAIMRISPEQAILYYEFEPTGPWWELSRQLVTPVKIDAPQSIFGNPLNHVAHRADVVRLQKLIEHGGIYLDADVFIHRDFDELYNCQTVLGEEGVDGLANAVILAEKNSPFLRRWLNEYRTFEGGLPGTQNWNLHSVHLPRKLALSYPAEITVLPETAFFWPDWSDRSLKWIFDSDAPIPRNNAFANHLWENFAWDYLEDLTPGKIRSSDTNFNFWARPLVDDLPADFGAPNLTTRLQHRLRKIARRARNLKSSGKKTAVRLLPAPFR